MSGTYLHGKNLYINKKISLATIQKLMQAFKWETSLKKIQNLKQSIWENEDRWIVQSLRTNVMILFGYLEYSNATFNLHFFSYFLAQI